jgi:2'-deoxynucleoside 5'-phosphate N-hydrolase
MKIYFGFTVAGDRSTVETARRIVQLLEELGHEVLTRHLVSESAWAADRLISPQDVYRRDMRWLQQCDLFLAEVSGSSFGLGFEAGYLLGATEKQVILFFRQEMKEKISLLITGNMHSNCTLVPYTSASEAETFIKINLACEAPQAGVSGSGNV